MKQDVAPLSIKARVTMGFLEAGCSKTGWVKLPTGPKVAGVSLVLETEAGASSGIKAGITEIC